MEPDRECQRYEPAIPESQSESETMPDLRCPVRCPRPPPRHRRSEMAGSGIPESREQNGLHPAGAMSNLFHPRRVKLLPREKRSNRGARPMSKPSLKMGTEEVLALGQRVIGSCMVTGIYKVTLEDSGGRAQAVAGSEVLPVAAAASRPAAVLDIGSPGIGRLRVGRRILSFQALETGTHAQFQVPERNQRQRRGEILPPTINPGHLRCGPPKPLPLPDSIFDGRCRNRSGVAPCPFPPFCVHSGNGIRHCAPEVRRQN